MAKDCRLSQVDERTIEELLEMQLGKPQTFVALSLLYHWIDWNGSTWHFDHIIPQADAQKNALRGRNLGFSENCVAPCTACAKGR